MNSKIWGIIGGFALVIALLSPLVLGNSKKIEQLFADAEMLYERSNYKGAITKYKEALEESKKLGARTESIDTDFTTLANLKIAQCYYELAEKTSDIRYYQTALIHIKEVVLDTQVAKHQEELTYLWAENLYKIGELDQANSKFSWLIEKFPNSPWVPKALYTIGEINYQQQHCEAALDAYQKLIEKFPRSEFAVKAQAHIQLMTNSNSDRGCNKDDHESQAKVIYDTAYDLQQQGKVHDAYQLYTDLITQYPKSEYVTDAYTGKAEIHLQAKDYVNARANYEEAIYSTTDAEGKKELYEAYHRTYLVPVYPDRKRQRDPIGELFVKARLLRKEDRFLEAAETYAQITSRNLPSEDIVYALYWEGRCYYKAAQTDPILFSRSVDALTKLTTDYENNQYNIKAYYYLTFAYTDWAKASVDLSKYELVINTVERVNANYADSNDSGIQESLSRMRKLKRDALKKVYPLKEEARRVIQDAEAAIVNATRENRNSQLIHQANQHLEYAKQQTDINNYEEAINAGKKTIEIIKPGPPPPPPPPDSQHYVDKGYGYLEEGELRKALEEVEQALNLDRNYAPADELKRKIKERYYTRGWTFFDEEQYDKAIVEFKYAINIDSDFKEAYCYLGAVYIEQEKYDEAIKALRKAINIDDHFKEAHFNLALAHLQLGEFQAAIDSAQAALKIDPSYELPYTLIKFIAD